MIRATLASLTLAASAAAAAQPATDLQAIAACVSAGPIKGVETVRRGGTATSRTLTLAGQPDRRVSVLDGYRVMLATAPGQYFVNLKIERSAPDQAEADRAAIREMVQALAAQAPAGSPPLKREQGGGVETLGLDQPSLERSGTLGFYTFFAPRGDLVVTAYLLNPPRAFATYADYERLRDQAIAQIKSCLPN
jgi:hypothetical protein